MRQRLINVDNVALAALLFAVISIASVSTVAMLSAKRFVAANEQAHITQRVVASLESIRYHALAIETGEQNYVITGSERELTPYRSARVELTAEIAYLAERRDVLKRLDENYVALRAAIERLVAQEGRIVEARRRDGFEAARILVTRGGQQEVQEEVLRHAYRILAEARGKLDAMQIEQIAYAERMQGWIIALIVFSALILAIFYAAVRKLDRDQRLVREKATYLAMHDSLTGLPNRSAVIEHIDRRLADDEAERALGGFAVMLVDLDGFKDVNDSMGHDVGDELLKQVSARMSGVLRDSDFLARLGGDEFLIVIPQISDRETAVLVAEKIVAVVGKPFLMSGGRAQVGASIGVSLFPQDAADRETLMKTADMAMYAAKRAGRNQIQFYSRHMRGHTHR